MKRFLWVLGVALAGCPAPPPAPAPSASAPPAMVMPWPAPAGSRLLALIKEAGLQPVGIVADPSAYVVSLACHLDVFQDGRPVFIPAGIGLDPEQTQTAPVHTHRADGWVWVESDRAGVFTLGQFFKLWAVPLDGATVFADGLQVANPEKYALRAGAEVVVAFGAPPAEVPAAAPPSPVP